MRPQDARPGMVVLDMAGRSADRRLEVLSEPRERADGAVEFFSTAGRSVFRPDASLVLDSEPRAVAREAEMEAG
jgi:hypothetical protein